MMHGQGKGRSPAIGKVRGMLHLATSRRRPHSPLVSERFARWASRLAVSCFAVAAVLVAPAIAIAAIAPHVADGNGTDACAICHRAHTANTQLPYRSQLSVVPTANALVLSADAGRGDVDLCYACHGIASLGASTDVESSFAMESTHSLAPSTSLYGPSPKLCGSCHDSHGQDRAVGGLPYPRLLRAWATTSTLVFSGDEYCATCHAARPSSRFAGLDVYKRTGHYTAMPAPADGTAISCLQCHAAHGSDIAPLLANSVAAPAAPATSVVAANDRRECVACHPAASATWSGATAYARSSHGLATATVPIVAEWPKSPTVRRTGECQVCHDPMGRPDGAGGTIPKLAENRGRVLCDTCHKAGGAAKTDLASLAYPPTEATKLELAVAYAPAAPTARAGRLAVYSRATAGPSPRPLVGPREYTAPGSVGRISTGDIDGDGRSELVMGEPGVKHVTVYQRDDLRGITRQAGPGVLPIGVNADFVAVADVTVAGVDLGLPEICVVDDTAHELWIYRYLGSVLTTVDGPLPVGPGVTGIASGDVTGTAKADLAITCSGDDTLRIFTESGGTMVSTVSTTLAGVRGPSIGDAWDRGAGSKDEVVVCEPGAATPGVSVFDGGGALLGSIPATGQPGAVPYASVVANVLPGVNTGSSGREIAVALMGGTGTSAVEVYPQAALGGPDAGNALTYVTGARYASGSLAAGDVDGDGRDELVVGNAGIWAKDVTRQGPSVQVLRANLLGLALDPAATITYPGGGSEMAGPEAPSLALADLGAVGPSRHPIDEVARTAHVSTETASVVRHVTCDDCHNVHEATSTVGAAPAVGGRMLGARGVALTDTGVGSFSIAAPARAANEYEVCARCHSSYVPLAGRGDVATDFNTYNASVHAVKAPSTSATATAGSFEAGWSNSSVLRCTDCHSNADATKPAGPHTASAAPILRRPLWGVSPEAPDLLCYRCHLVGTYLDGTTDSGGRASRFNDSSKGTSAAFTINGKLHMLHTKDLGLGCGSCHVTHGSATELHLIRSDVGFKHSLSDDGGSCDNACHTAPHSYKNP